MKETTGSLKAYFIVIGLFGLYIYSLTITAAFVLGLDLGLLLIGLIGFAFAIAYLYIGIKLRKLLAESPQTVMNVIYANLAYTVLNFLLGLIGFSNAGIIQLIISLLLSWYLLNSVKRLSQQ